MHTPTKAQWQTVIDNFEKVLPQADSSHSFNMGEIRVNTDDYVCGSCHCIGGWYAVATLDTSSSMNYRAGAMQMAMDLGFTAINHLKDWAEGNSYIWGNRCGSMMFSHTIAYKYASTLAGAIEYLKGVRDRSPD